MATPKKNVTEFDQALLSQMQEPLQLRVYRIAKGGMGREPIPLGQEAWSKEDAAKIEQIVLTDIAGGGAYEGQCTGAAGKTFKWKFMFPETTFPPKTPPASMVAAAPVYPQPGNGLAQAPVGAVWNNPQAMVAQGYRVPPHVPAYQAPAPPPAPYGAPSPYATARYPQAGLPYVPPAPWMAPQAPTSGDATMRRELEQLRAQNAAAEHRREREAADAKHAAEMAAMREEVRRLAESSTKKPRGDDDPVILQMKQANELLKQQMENQSRQLETEKAERARADQEARHREEASRRDEQHRREMDELKRLIADASTNKTDPMMLMMMEQMRSSGEAQREQSRQAAEAARENARAAQNAPQQLMGLVEGIRRSSGADTLMQNVAGAYDGAMGMMTRNMELVNQMVMGQQGSPGWQLLGEGMDGVKELLGNVMTERQKTEQAKAKAEEADSNAKIVHEQVVYAQAQAQAAAAVAVEEGTPEAQAAAEAAQNEADAKANEHASAVKEAVEAEQEAEAAEAEIEGHEEKIFGAALAEVKALREHVANEDPSPQIANDVAKGVVQAAYQIKKMKLAIPAFALYDEHRFADLIDHLLPDISSEFSGACVGEIARLSQLVTSSGIDSLGTPAADPPVALAV